MPDELRAAGNLISAFSDPDGLIPRKPLGAGEAATQTLALYEESGREGATLSLLFDDMSRQPLYSVSVWPERGRTSPGDTVSLRILQLFIEANLDLLGDPRCGVALWYNADADVTYRDIVAILPDRQEAIALALRYDQIAIYDLHDLTGIETGGTGNTPTDMPPATERLPKMNLEKEEQL